MKKNSFELAAIASAAVSNLNITAVAPLDDALGDSALIVDSKRKKWHVRSLSISEHSAQLDHELQNLKIFTPTIRASLPFSTAFIVGALRQDDVKTYVYSYLEGDPLDTLALEKDSDPERNILRAQSAGQSLAALHSIPIKALDANSLPCYSAADFRRRKLKELDQAATAGKIPARLLSRWETILEDVSLWHFTPTVVHGDLHEDNILIKGSDVAAFTGWSNLHGGDPAEDFIWLTTLSNANFKETVFQEYERHLAHPCSPHLLKRASFHAEFALAQWLIEGLVTDDEKKILEAEEMLQSLDNDLEHLKNSATVAIEKPTDSISPSAQTSSELIQ